VGGGILPPTRVLSSRPPSVMLCNKQRCCPGGASLSPSHIREERALPFLWSLLKKSPFPRGGGFLTPFFKKRGPSFFREELEYSPPFLRERGFFPFCPPGGFFPGGFKNSPQNFPPIFTKVF